MILDSRRFRTVSAWFAKLLTHLAAAAGRFILTLVVLGGVAALVMWILKPKVPRRAVLELDFSGALAEVQPRRGVMSLIIRQAPTLHQVVEHIDRASGDRRIVQLVARIYDNSMGYAKVQELRDAVIRFRKSGKRAIAFAETFGDPGPADKSYYLATAFDSIYLQPSGQFALTGLLSRVPFARDLLSKLGVQPRFDKRKEFKSASDVITEREFTGPHEENLRTVLGSLQRIIIDAIAERRNKKPSVVQSEIDGGPYNPGRALELGYIDGVLYYDELCDRIQNRHRKKRRLFPYSRYDAAVGRRRRQGRRAIALIYCVGDIYRGASRITPFGSPLLGAQTVGKAIREAVDDSSVRVIVLRVNSPGGSYIASDMIWHEVMHARERGKTVIASLSDVAGSGGYFIAMAADKIVAAPGTITGSIGVISGKLVTEEMWKKLGVNWAEIHTGVNAPMWLSTRDFTPEQWTVVQRQLDTIYHDFVAKASRGRSMDFDRMESLARGRIYTGLEAAEAGLVDTIGGLPEALDMAVSMIGAGKKERIGVRIFPRRRWVLRPDNFLSPKAENANCFSIEKLSSLIPFLRDLDRRMNLDLPYLLLMESSVLSGPAE